MVSHAIDEIHRGAYRLDLQRRFFGGRIAGRFIVTQTQFVGYRDRGFWAYDVALGVFLKHLVDVSEAYLVGSGGDWLANAIDRWRQVAVISDYGLEIDTTWSVSQLEIFVKLVDQACEQLGSRESISAEEIAAWSPMFDDLRIFARGAAQIKTAPVVELAKAILSLVDGTLPAAPAGTWWFFGTPLGRDTIRNHD